MCVCFCARRTGQALVDAVVNAEVACGIRDFDAVNVIVVAWILDRRPCVSAVGAELVGQIACKVGADDLFVAIIEGNVHFFEDKVVGFNIVACQVLRTVVDNVDILVDAFFEIMNKLIEGK